MNLTLQNKKVEITILTTGGTLEKSYNEGDGSLDNRDSFVKNIITQKLRLPYTQLNVWAVMNKDSLDMNEEDRLTLLYAIKANLSKPVVILHGTDRMSMSADFVYNRIEAKEMKHPIIFTGAMKPIGFEDSDALQNITESLILAKVAKPGVYISFHSRLFEVPHVRKNKDLKTFEYFQSVGDSGA